MAQTRVHLIGVCGTAMATLAALLKSKGFDVRGSDQNVYPPMSDFLVQQGITLLQGYDPAHISSDLDLVVVGNAISRGNPELEEVLDRKIRYCSLPEAIRDHVLWRSRAIVIAGTHGKTTTTALTGWLLADGGADPSVLIGGIAENFDGSFRVGGGREFVIEGDEYDSAFFDKTAKFLKYLPDIAVVGNVEFDHADIYPDLDAIRLAFQRFVNLVPRRGLLLLGADNDEALALRSGAKCKVETFGLADGADWRKPRPGSASGAGARPSAHSNCRFSAPTTCATRWRRLPLAPRSASTRTRWPARCGASRAYAGGWNCAAPSAAFRSSTISPIIRPRLPRRWPASVRLTPADTSGPSSSRDPRPRAAVCFRGTSRRRWRAPIAWFCRRSFAPACRMRTGCRLKSSSQS
jgi:hypothetical protein